MRSGRCRRCPRTTFRHRSASPSTSRSASWKPRAGRILTLVRRGERRVDLALTLPIFIAYHLGVVFLNIRNASDVVTSVLMQLAEGNKGVYVLLTLAIGVVFATVFGILGRGQAFKTAQFIQIAIEGVV